MSEIHEMNRTLGGLKSSVESMTSMWREQEKAASEGRQFLHDKFDSLKNDMTLLNGRVDMMARDMTDFKPSIKAYNDSRLREEGARRLGKLIWAAVLTAAGFTGWGIATLLHWAAGGRP